MARIKGGLGAKKRHNRVLKLAKGYRGARSKQYRIAKQTVMKALSNAYAGRKQNNRKAMRYQETGIASFLRDKKDASAQVIKAWYAERDSLNDFNFVVHSLRVAI